jgi:hypothetical protein
MKRLVSIVVLMLVLGCADDEGGTAAANGGSEAGAAGMTEAGTTGQGGMVEAGTAGQGGVVEGGTAGEGGVVEAGTAGEGGVVEAGTAGEGGAVEAGTAGEGGMVEGGSAGTPSNVPPECNEQFAGQGTDGACLNDDDKIVLCALEDTIDDIMETCGTGDCIGQIGDTSVGGGLATCGRDCMIAETNFSDGCSSCFGEILACTMRECGVQALGAISGDRTELEACVAENCDDDFSACAGVSLNDR